MPTPQPIDPLYEPLTRFVNALGQFLTLNGLDVDFPQPPEEKSGNPLIDMGQIWETLKKGLAKSHQALVGVEPKVDENLQQIVAVGSEVVSMTSDPNIISPVQQLVQLAKDERADIGNLVVQLSEATSLIPILSLIGNLTGIRTQIHERRQKFIALLAALISYYGLNLPSPN
ncbi:Uncharacterised protein [Mycobacteroides abscessus subsp. abscessus]|uniref:hypothetical protein n=1 Tax=Mycobacteroides abscessus TaxID=36809 RepID=UPI0009A831F9|nr:hypothetical protein [Mycobacteroides abscessus]SLI70560.1 Uncharacterised protein [Mycobacteroides abscessus subsp. abscessus]